MPLHAPSPAARPHTTGDATFERALGSAALRLSGRVEAVAYGDLDAHEQELLATLRTDPDFHGILRSRRSAGLTVRTVDRATARLISGLGRGRCLSDDERASLGNEAHRVLARLILDGALEIRVGRRFVSGADACQVVLSGEPPASGPHALGALSLSALRYAWQLRTRSPRLVAQRLYAFNTAPVTPRWLQRLPNSDAAAAYLGLSDRSTRTLLERCWRHDEAVPTNGWRYFRPRASASASGPDALTWKLYVSIGLAALGDALPRIVRVLAGKGGPYFKVGCDLYNLLRPDKLLVYFDSMDALLACAHDLAPELAGIEAQGVPFTAPIDEGALLSWGIDPAHHRGLPTWVERDSWRTWISNRLSRYLAQARGARRLEVEPWHYAFARLRLEGVDVRTWAPEAGWRREYGDLEAAS